MIELSEKNKKRSWNRGRFQLLLTIKKEIML